MSVWKFLSCAVLALMVARDAGAERGRKLPDYIPVCRRNDPKFSQCIVDGSHKLRPHLAKGIPEIRIPPLEPFFIPEMNLERGQERGGLGLIFHNISLQGLTDYTVSSMEADVVDKYKIEGDFFMPNIVFDAICEMKGRVLRIPIHGKGPFRAVLNNTKAHVVLNGRKAEKDGQLYYGAKKVTINLDIGKAKLEFDNLFTGDGLLGETSRRFLRENSLAIINDLKPGLEEVVSRIVDSIANKVYDSTPYEKLFPLL